MMLPARRDPPVRQPHGNGDSPVRLPRPPARARPVPPLLSYGHGHRHHDSGSETDPSEDDSSTDDSSGYEKSTSKRRQPAPPAVAGISPTVAVLGVLLILAIAAAVSLGIRNFRSAESELATSSSAQGNSAGGTASAPGTITQTITSIVTSSDVSSEPSLPSSSLQTGSASAGRSKQSSPTKTRQGASPSQAAASTGSTQPASSANGAGADAAFIKTILDGHGDFRNKHHASDLIWNKTLQAAAEKWAKHCVWEHSGGKVGPFGENLSAVVPFQQNDEFDPMSGISVWNGEEKDYDYSKPTGFTHETGHVVWIGTQQIGCAFTTCEGFFGHPLGAFFVCEYWPGGNIVTDDLKYFKDNVKPP